MHSGGVTVTTDGRGSAARPSPTGKVMTTERSAGLIVLAALGFLVFVRKGFRSVLT